MADAALHFDVASAQCLGARESQQDAIATHFVDGSDLGIVVLADGMGGHAAGEVASKIAVTEVFSELCLKGDTLAQRPAEIPEMLHQAALGANICLRQHAEAHAETEDMGCTLVVVLCLQDQLYWLSVGDSVLCLLRDGAYRRLNADHSMAPQLALMCRNGELTEEETRRHPLRNALTSALTGAPIPRVDCPTTPMPLASGDVLLVASDGVESLTDDRICAVLDRANDGNAHGAARSLLRAVQALDDPEQDNTTLSVIKVSTAEPAIARDLAVPAISRLIPFRNTVARSVSRMRRLAGGGA